MGMAAVIPILASVAGSLVSGMMNKKGDSAQTAAPEVQAATPAPQASKAPDVAAFANTNAANAASQGPGSTLLTGLGGVPNSSLNLGKNQLLGA